MAQRLLTVVCTMLDTSRLRATLFLVLSLAGCVTGEELDGEDIDGGGKADSVSSSSPDHLVDTPFYFGVPKTAITAALPRPDYPYPTVWNTAMQSSDVGLRIIAIQQSSGVAAHQRARREMAQKLAAAGVLKDGDIVLTFRPELASTMAYPHIQMGTTHAGLVYTDGGAAYNIDSPLDTSYVGQFDAPHYAGNGGNDAGTDALHIVRPRELTDARRTQLRTWVKTLKAALPRINGQRAQVKFQSDYLTPAYVSAGMTTRQTVTTLGKIILEADTDTKLPMYCSEFAWHMLALSGCSADEIRTAPDEGAACVDEVFAPMPLVARTADEVGLAEGPLLALLAVPAQIRAPLVDDVFATGDAATLSSGHRAVSEQVAPLMGPLSQLYTARAGGAPVEATAAAAEQLDATMPNNYSPTTFLIQAMGPEATRSMDYVATVAFVDAAGYAKAQTLSRNPVP